MQVIRVLEKPKVERTVFGHPAGLFVLFFTEMWERFSYYGMRVLLVLYMTDYLIQSARAGKTVFGFEILQSTLHAMFGPLEVQPLASQIYGLYTGFVYLTPLFGGMIADRLLGQRKTVVIGAVLMAIGHFLMAIESMFFLALLFLILGNGCFKPNISTQVGSLYPPGDERRDRAFSIFYMGINLGAFFSPLVCGTLGQIYGWHYGFGAAGIGMLVGLLVYLFGQRYLPQERVVEKNEKAMVEHPPLTSTDYKAIGALLVLCALSGVFWAVYEQQGNTLQLFADRNTDWSFFGFELPSTWFQSLNPMFIFLLTPLLNIFWEGQAAKGKEPNSIAKMAIGCILLGLSFAVLMYAILGVSDDQKIHFSWLVGCALVYTVGELYFSPIGLSMVTKVAPPKLVGMLMGMWFLSSFFGNYLSGFIGTYYSVLSKQEFFFLLLAMGVIAGLAIFSIYSPLKRAIGSKI